jgi:hypothetical protein
MPDGGRIPIRNYTYPASAGIRTGVVCRGILAAARGAARNLVILAIPAPARCLFPWRPCSALCAAGLQLGICDPPSSCRSQTGPPGRRGATGSLIFVRFRGQRGRCGRDRRCAAATAAKRRGHSVGLASEWRSGSAAAIAGAPSGWVSGKGAGCSAEEASGRSQVRDRGIWAAGPLPALASWRIRYGPLVCNDLSWQRILLILGGHPRPPIAGSAWLALPKAMARRSRPVTVAPETTGLQIPNPRFWPVMPKTEIPGYGRKLQWTASAHCI